jgi:hypothetical protein
MLKTDGERQSVFLNKLLLYSEQQFYNHHEAHEGHEETADKNFMPFMIFMVKIIPGG